MFVIFHVEAEGTGFASGKPHSIKSRHRGYVVRHDVLNDDVFTCREQICFVPALSQPNINTNLNTLKVLQFLKAMRELA